MATSHGLQVDADEMEWTAFTLLGSPPLQGVEILSASGARDATAKYLPSAQQLLAHMRVHPRHFQPLLGAMVLFAKHARPFDGLVGEAEMWRITVEALGSSPGLEQAAKALAEAAQVMWRAKEKEAARELPTQVGLSFAEFLEGWRCKNIVGAIAIRQRRSPRPCCQLSGGPARAVLANAILVCGAGGRHGHPRALRVRPATHGVAQQVMVNIFVQEPGAVIIYVWNFAQGRRTAHRWDAFALTTAQGCEAAAQVLLSADVGAELQSEVGP
ncbi:hypothetical protein CYMTET_34953 [Cymbomonas tetramitiformis]|uniref:Uncharacterized protein n=1 Tax=Cymbomonas tetramitiformis TaxID=36881 RepID=A0AAE0FA87_9CHLO|nr:hypothetical protein CYMTET_34953 [Cymbomonas tetramitiformis]